MFDSVTLASHNYLQRQIDDLKDTCNKDPAVAEMVRYILAYSDQLAYCGGDEDARIGRQIIQHIWEISGIDLSNMGNEYHFSPNWASKLNHFIGNYIYDDSAFDFEVSEHGGTIEFKGADDNGRWLQDAQIIVEAARANHAYFRKMDQANIFDRIRERADITRVLELIK